MLTADQIVDRYFLEMRWRALSLAADLDRIERAEGGTQSLQNDPRLQKLHQALQLLLTAHDNRAEQVQRLFSDASPSPAISKPSVQDAQ